MASEKEPKAAVSCNPKLSRANRKLKLSASGPSPLSAMAQGWTWTWEATPNPSELPAPSPPALFPSTAVFRILENSSGLQSFLAFHLPVPTTSISGLKFG